MAFNSDDDDGIPLDNPHAELGICWSCQEEIPGSGQPVSLSPDLLPQVCMTCWLDMTVAERINIAIQLVDRDRDNKSPGFGSRN